MNDILSADIEIKEKMWQLSNVLKTERQHDKILWAYQLSIFRKCLMLTKID